MQFKNLLDPEKLKLAALARLHDGELETMPTLEQIRLRVYQDLAETGMAVYSLTALPRAHEDVATLQAELKAEGWVAFSDLSRIGLNQPSLWVLTLVVLHKYSVWLPLEFQAPHERMTIVKEG